MFANSFFKSSGMTRNATVPDGADSPDRVVMLEEMISQWIVPQNATTDSQDFWSSDSGVTISSLWLSATKCCAGESALTRAIIPKDPRPDNPAVCVIMARDGDGLMAAFSHPLTTSPSAASNKTLHL